MGAKHAFLCLALLLAVFVGLAYLPVAVHADSLPDLTVDSIWLEDASQPGQPVSQVSPGESFLIVATIKNIGQASAPGFYLDVYYDNDYGRGGPDNIAAGEVQTWYVGPLTATNGTHTTKWVVNPDNLIAESNESNNEKDFTFTVGQQAPATTTAEMTQVVTATGTMNVTSYTTTTVTSYTGTQTSTSTIVVPTTVTVSPSASTSTVQTTQALTSTGTQTVTGYTTTTVTSYTGTQTSTSTVVVPTTVTVSPSASTSTVQTTQALASTGTKTVTSYTTTTVTSYTGTQTSTSTVVVPTTVTVSPSTSTSTVQTTQALPSTSTTQTTQVLTSIGTKTVTSYTTMTITSYSSTSTSTSTSVVYKTLTTLAGAAASSPLACLGFLSLFAVTVGQKVTTGKGRRIRGVAPLRGLLTAFSLRSLSPSLVDYCDTILSRLMSLMERRCSID
jgi:hypothetical protein